MELIVNGPIFAKKACELVNLASQFKEEILISTKERSVDAKSLLGVLSLALVQGDRIELIAPPEVLSSFSRALEQLDIAHHPVSKSS